jgi:hypothetical protein
LRFFNVVVDVVVVVVDDEMGWIGRSLYTQSIDIVDHDILMK